MLTESIRILPFETTLSREKFDCGVEALNLYLRNIVSQDVRRNLAVCYAMLPGNRDEVIGYYTLSATSVVLDSLLANKARKLRYPVIPAALLGRLAVDRRFTGEGLGKVLLYDAVERTRRAEIACYAVIVDAKDEKARNFYISFGFEPLKVSRLKLFFVL